MSSIASFAAMQPFVAAKWKPLSIPTKTTGHSWSNRAYVACQVGERREEPVQTHARSGSYVGNLYGGTGVHTNGCRCSACARIVWAGP